MAVIMAAQQGTKLGWALRVGGANLTSKVPLDESPIRITESLGSPAQMDFTVEDTTGTISLLHGQFVTLERVTIQPNGDRETQFRYFGGHLIDHEMSRLPGRRGRSIRCRALGFEAWLDWRTVPNYSSRTNVNGRVLRVHSDRAIIQELVSRHGAKVKAGAYVDATNTDMAVVAVRGVTLREALERVADVATIISPEATRDFYVDHYGRLHYYSGSESLSAAYRIADGYYTREIIRDGPVELWTFGDATGDTALGEMDYSDATLTGGYTRGSSAALPNEPQRTSTRFDGVDAQASASGANLEPGDTFSLECWFKRASNGTMFLIRAGTNGYRIGFDNNNKVNANKVGTGDHFVSDNSYTDTAWHHLVWTRSPGNSDFYVDGAAITGTTTARTFASSGGSITIGGIGGAFFNGRLSHVAIYNSKLSASDVLAHYNQGISLSPEGLVYSRNSAEKVHRVYVKGSNAQGSGWVDPGVGDFAGGKSEAYLDEPDSTSVAKRNAYGQAYVRQHGRIDSLRFSVTHRFAGWALGQLVYVSDEALGFDSDPQEIRELTTDFNLGNGMHTYEMVLGNPRLATFHRGRRRRRR